MFKTGDRIKCVITNHGPYDTLKDEEGVVLEFYENPRGREFVKVQFNKIIKDMYAFRFILIESKKADSRLIDWLKS